MDRSMKAHKNMDIIEMEEITPSSVKRPGDDSDSGSSSNSASECCLTALRTGKCLSTTSSVMEVVAEEVAKQPTPSSSQASAVRTADKSTQTKKKTVRFPAPGVHNQFLFEMNPSSVEPSPPTPPLPPLTMNTFKQRKKVVLWNTRSGVRNMNVENWEPERQFFRRQTGIAVLNRKDICECMRSEPRLLQALKTQQMPPMGSCEHAAAVATMRRHFFEEQKLEVARCQLAQMRLDEDAAVSPPPQFKLPALEAPPLELPPLEAPPLELPPLEEPPFEAPPFEAPPCETPRFEAPPFEAPPCEVHRFEAPPCEVHRFKAPPLEAPPLDPPAPLFEAPPIEAPPCEAHRFEAPPFEAPPLEAPPLDPPALPFEAPPLDSPAPLALSRRLPFTKPVLFHSADPNAPNAYICLRAENRPRCIGPLAIKRIKYYFAQCPGFKDIEMNATQTVATIHYTTCDQVRYAKRILEGITVTGSHRLHISFAYSDQPLEDPKPACLYHLAWRATKMIAQKKKANRRSIQQ